MPAPKRPIRTTIRPVSTNGATHRATNMSTAVTTAIRSRATPSSKILNRGKISEIAQRLHVSEELLIKELAAHKFDVR